MCDYPNSSNEYAADPFAESWIYHPQTDHGQSDQVCPYVFETPPSRPESYTPFPTLKPIYLPERQDLAFRYNDEPGSWEQITHNDTDGRHMAMLSGSRTSQKLQTMPNVFCPSCAEDGGKPKRFKSKYGYKRHEENHHYYGGLEWYCQDCRLVIDGKSQAMKHFRELHPTKNQEMLALRGQIQLLPRYRFGCGFHNCQQWFKSWKERCDHVTTHMECGDTSDLWDFSTVILNLLRQDGVRDEWVRRYGDIESSLYWRVADCRVLRQKLECRDFRPGLSDLLKAAFDLGINGAMSPTGIEQPFQLVLQVPSRNSILKEPQLN